MIDDSNSEEEIGKELERNLNDFFGGIGKERTLLSETWRKWISDECEFAEYYGEKWECLGAWDDENIIHFTIKDPDEYEAVHGVYKRDICRNHAARTFAGIRHIFHNPRERLLKEGTSIAPKGIANPNLYEELFCLGHEGDKLIAEYEALGGEYE
jgi:hypothetical protein